MTLTIESLAAPDEVLRLENEGLYELVDGQLVEKPMSELATETASLINFALMSYVKPKSAGRVLCEQSFKCFPHNESLVRRPDLAFIAAARASHPRETGHVTVVPDIAIEVVSPTNTALEVEEKVEDYTRAGIALIWVVYPETRTAMVYRIDGKPDRLRDDDSLPGDAILPGFSVKLADVLPAV